MDSDNNNNNTSNFSENYVMEKTELAMQLLLLFNITSLEEKNV